MSAVTAPIVLLAVLPLVVFYLWMFRDMVNNPELSSDARYSWTLAFVLMNAFAAALYFVEYKYRS